jgi:hypothetical protein
MCVCVCVCIYISEVGQDSSVGIVTSHRLDGPENEPHWRRDFSHPSRPSLLFNGYRVAFPGVKRPGRGDDHPPPSSAKVKNE